MTKDFFPPDVSVRLRGDRVVAQSHIGEARKLLFKAINTGNNPCSLTQHFDDGTTAVCLILGKQKLLTILAPAVPVPEVPEEPTPNPEIEFGFQYRPEMYSGWTRDHTVVDNALHSFWPSPACAQAYELNEEWQDVEKLNTSPMQVKQVTPSQFTGAMKRVVQALLGVGITTDESPSYLTGAVVEGPRQINATYSYTWAKSHGIYKAGAKNHWLIEISSANGVLAMPLITLPISRTASFRTFLVNRGDTDTLKVVDEFGGIPNGETFPTNAITLQNYINAGKILRLLTPTQLNEFYSNAAGFASHLGWAFSETSGEAANTCWRLGVDPYGQIYTMGDLWKLNINLSEHDVALLDENPPQPVGTGSASLVLEHRGLVPYGTFSSLFVPSSSKDLANAHTYYSLPAEYLLVGGFNYATQTFGYEYGCYLTVFYEGNVLKRIKVTPEVAIRSGYYDRYEWITYGVIKFEHADRSSWSPLSFVFDSYVDLRAVNTSMGFGKCSTFISGSWPTGWPNPFVDERGDISYAETVGSGFYQNFACLLPRDFREAAVLHYQSVTQGFSGTACAPEPATPAVSQSVLVGYFNGYGVKYLDSVTTDMETTSYGDSWRTLLKTKTAEFAARGSASGEQWVMSAWVKWKPDDNAKPTPEPITNVPRADLDDVQPYNMNWVGAPD